LFRVGSQSPHSDVIHPISLVIHREIWTRHNAQLRACLRFISFDARECSKWS